MANVSPSWILDGLFATNKTRLPALPDADWHLQHYHKPYHFGAKLPHFGDYDAATTTNDDAMQLSPDRSTGAQQQLSNYDRLAQLSCDSGEMILRLNFSEPFKGIVYPDHNRLSPCRFFGDGHLNYELRLPLRGCGTRQAAPRVFVNDVIVRFHKSLELEEDEVKTLICRYPPPSSMQAGSSLAGKFSGSLEQESLPPFELVDPLSGRPARGQPGSAQEPGSTGNIETLSENLVVAPAQGNFLGVPGQSADTARHSDYTTPIGRLVQPTDTMAPPVGGSFLERLSTIELLFLISSLMFLALLALGLVAGYYFVRRRESSSRHASAILRRKRRFLGPNQHLGGAQAALHAAGPAVVHQYQRQAPSSSPDDSDLSGRGLLGGQQQRLVPMQPYYFNLAYAAPELGPHRQPYAAQFAAHAHALGRRQQPGPAELQVQGRRLEQHQQAAHSMGRRQLKRAKLAAGEPTLLQFAQPAPPADSSHTFGKARAVPAYAMDDAVGGALWRAKSLSNVDTEPRPNRLVGGTLSRHELRQQAEASWRHQLLETLARPHSQRFHHHQHHRAPPDGDEQQQNRTSNQKPRLLLKSIEDSYITKVSEVCEQEYMKRDSTRPLSLTEWRSLIQQQQQPQPDNKTINGSSEDEQEDNKRQSTNLRSLTELDVNFAKTLRQSSTGTTGDELLLQLEQKEPPPPAATTTDKQSESPDLILSPEYDYDRLELEPNKASSSRNSVSYA